MDAKPLKTHKGAYRAFRIIGTCLTIFGATSGTLFFFDSIILFLLLGPFSSVYVDFADFSKFMTENGQNTAIGFLIAGFVALLYFSGGIVFLAFSTRSRIKDANRGIDYQQMNS